MITDSPESSWLNDYQADPITRAQFFAPDGSLLPETNFKHGRIWQVDRMIVPASRVHEVIRNHHSSVIRNWRAPKTRYLLERRYTFPGLPTAVERFVEVLRHLPTHQVRARTPPRPPQGHRTSLPPLAVRQHGLGIHTLLPRL